MLARLRRWTTFAVVTAAVTLGLAAPASAATNLFTIQNYGSNYCLIGGLPTDSPSLYTQQENVAAGAAACSFTVSVWTIEPLGMMTSSNGLVTNYAYHIKQGSNCLSANYTSAYMTPCTTTIYQKWIFDSGPISSGQRKLGHLINVGTSTSSTQVLSSNLTCPKNSCFYPSGTVYPATYNDLVYYQAWFIAAYVP